VDFDLFTNKEFKNLLIKRRISRVAKIDKVIVNQPDELTISVGGVKFTFFNYPYKISYSERLDNIIRLPEM
jgi:hypothetical protein